MDEVFGSANFVAQIAVQKTSGSSTGNFLEGVIDHVLWFAKDLASAKFRHLLSEKRRSVREGAEKYTSDTEL